MTNCAVVTWKCAVVKVILCSFDSDVRIALNIFRNLLKSNPSRIIRLFFSLQLQYDEHCQLPKSAMRTYVVTYSLLSIATCRKYVAFMWYASQFWFKFNQSALRASQLPPLAQDFRSLHHRGEDKCWSELFQTIRGVGKGSRGTCLPPKFPMLKIFSVNSAAFVTLNRIFSMFIGFLGASPLDPIQGSDRVWTLLGTDGTPFVPSETNSWLRPCRPCQLVENFGLDLPG